MKTEKNTDSISQLRTIAGEIRECCRLAFEAQKAPTASIQAIEDDFKAQSSKLREKHQQQRKDLETAQRQESKDLENKKILATSPHCEAIAESNRLLADEIEVHRATARGLNLDNTLESTVELIPEDIRPTLIPVDSGGYNMYLVQIKLAPHIAFVIRADQEKSTRWIVTISSDFSEHNHRALCFCCLDEDQRPGVLSTLSTICNQRGIKNVIGRRVSETIDGVSFSDGEYYPGLIEKAVTDPETRKYLGQYLSIHD